MDEPIDDNALDVQGYHVEVEHNGTYRLSEEMGDTTCDLENHGNMTRIMLGMQRQGRSQLLFI